MDDGSSQTLTILADPSEDVGVHDLSSPSPFKKNNNASNRDTAVSYMYIRVPCFSYVMHPPPIVDRSSHFP